MQKDILKQLRLHQNLKSKIIFIIILFLFSCNLKDTKEIITFTEKELALHKNGMPLIWEEEQEKAQPVQSSVET